MWFRRSVNPGLVARQRDASTSLIQASSQKNSIINHLPLAYFSFQVGSLGSGYVTGLANTGRTTVEVRLVLVLWKTKEYFGRFLHSWNSEIKDNIILSKPLAKQL